MELSSPLLTLTLDLAHTSLRLSTTTAPIPCTPLLRLRLVLGNIREVDGRSSIVCDKENYFYLNMFCIFSLSAGLAL